MKIIVKLCLITICFWSCTTTNEHQSPTHNFVVNRIIILNEQNEVLMSREENVWATPSFVYDKRQYVKEALDSLSTAYGIKIKDVELRGLFSYKYDYHPYSTLRNYFVAKLDGGKLITPDGLAETKWIPIDQAIEKNTVTSIKQITKQILKYPRVVWGGSFMVSHVGDEHPTVIKENFYPLFSIDPN
ncbi:NUDIX hydrolase [Aquimarina litoralis]|uniref:NUDIX hydrolase n=1 Tax=Aquimarina litoralis TaxID=584605 RepID=UPI001C57529C|nr:hypothetical protein [Aquimarina litoralis]MBW1297284.1 hypothetical protein [Aquimarina litoralis]